MKFAQLINFVEMIQQECHRSLSSHISAASCCHGGGGAAASACRGALSLSDTSCCRLSMLTASPPPSSPLWSCFFSFPLFSHSLLFCLFFLLFPRPSCSLFWVCSSSSRLSSARRRCRLALWRVRCTLHRLTVWKWELSSSLPREFLFFLYVNFLAFLALLLFSSLFAR
jgi:hypothetical protein